MRISDWSSDVCSSDLSDERVAATVGGLKVSQLTDDHYRDLAEFIAFIRKEWGGPPLRAPKFITYPTSYGNSSVRTSGPEYDAYQRSEERRVGREGVSTLRSRRAQCHEKKKREK